MTQLKAICPEHRRKDLESLIKKEKGNKDKINEQIQQWWEEPPKVEEVWEDVNKKKNTKPVIKYDGHRDRRDHRDRDGHRDRDRGDRELGNGRSNGNGIGDSMNNNNGNSERGGGGRGYGRSGSGDRGGRGYGRGMAGGRGGGSDRRGRGRGYGDKARKPQASQNGQGPASDPAPAKASQAPSTSGPAAANANAAAAGQKSEKKETGPAIAKPVTTRPLQGAWGARAAAAAAPEPAPVSESVPLAPPAPAPIVVEEIAAVEEIAPVVVEEIIEEPFVEENAVNDVAVSVSAQDPTPAGDKPDTSEPVPEAKPAPVTSGGNVWATKGSAHLINAEKPKKPLVVEESYNNAADEPLLAATEEDLVIESSTDNNTHVNVNVNALDDNLVNGDMNGSSNWVTDSSPVSVDVGDAPLMDIPTPEEIVLQVPPPVVEPVLPAPVPVPAVAPVEIETVLKPTSVLNMGHWETSEAEEVSHDFGFGSFGQENDVTSVDETTISSAAGTGAPAPVQENNVSVAAATVSPARPPPGLNIGGMPSMPEKIVHVHELESKLDNVNLNSGAGANGQDEEPKTSDALPENMHVPHHQQAMHTTGPPEGFQMQQPGVPQQSYAGQYGMGMYSYNGQAGGVAAPNGFMGVGVQGGAPPQQKQQGLGQQQAGGLPQQQSIYGAPTPTAQSSDTNAAGNETNGTSNPASGMPPGMPGMPHYNPALFYGQQPYLAGQPHGVSAYGFGYGQFGGVQAGYGYQQVMGQGAGYGQPYEDQAQHHGGNNHQGGYNNKNSGGGGGGGGYRGRNPNPNHHNQNQYQNQYNPPQGHGAYGGQPYNMGYNEQFNRGGYGQQPMDPYMQQQQQQQQNPGGYHQENDHGKGNKKGNNRNNFGNNQNMQQGYQQQGGNQFGGLQGAGASDSNNQPFQGWGNGGL